LPTGCSTGDSGPGSVSLFDFYFGYSFHYFFNDQTFRGNMKPAKLPTIFTVVIKPEARGRFHWTKVLVDTFVWNGAACGELRPLLAERRGPEWTYLLGMVSTINVKFP
jgi:hypothetical protein